jgi:hypothetical protein
MTSEAETKARLADLSIGFSRRAAQFARNILVRNLWSAPALGRVFRPHFKKSFRKKTYIEFRESFDEALDHLELLELSVETGYLSPEAVRQQSLREMRLLLKSEPAQHYLQHYDYLLVRFLAARFDFPLRLPPLNPPKPNPDAEVRFAVFLATHNEWTSDSNIELFTRLLDNYRFGERINWEFFSDYLLSNRKPELDAEEELCIQRLSDGLDRFVQLLGGLFAQLSVTERAYFGSFYAYWLAKFFGYELGKRGYEEAWESWEADVLKLYSLTIFPDRQSLEMTRKLRAVQIAAMRDTWNATRRLLGSAVRQAPTKTENRAYNLARHTKADLSSS